MTNAGDSLYTVAVLWLVFDLSGSTVLTGIANSLLLLPWLLQILAGPVVDRLPLKPLLVGSLVASAFERVPYGWLLLIGHSLGAGCWAASAFAPTPALTIVLFGLAWIPIGIGGVLSSTLNQTVFPADLLGRVSSTKGTASGATLPLGSLVGGFVAEMLGTTTTMGLAAFGFGFTGLYILLRPRLRRLPPIAEATPAAFGVTRPTERDGE